MSALRTKIENRETGMLLYSFTPPKHNTPADKLNSIAEKQVQRINSLDIDGVILYDIQDETHRTTEQRTFPFIHTIPPEEYLKKFLTRMERTAIIYKSIANQNKDSLCGWLNQNSDLDHLVFVGTSSSAQLAETNFSLTDAYNLRSENYKHILLGGVTIPERHAKKGDEHQRIYRKTQGGCRFFVSQCVYNVYETKNLLSDYYYDSLDNDHELNPIFFTLSPCGSFKTLEFMKWLGIEVPQWLFNDLKHSKDILSTSVKTSVYIANEILDFAASKNIPVGFNIESISNKKDEIEAATELLATVSKALKQMKGH